jgi:diguanylate cyclase (GGDEF)-like protein
MSEPPSGQERTRVVEEVKHLIANQTISLDEVRQRLTIEDLGVLRARSSADTDVSTGTHQRLSNLLDLVGGRRDRIPLDTHVSPDAEPVVVGAHGTVAHEVTRIRLMLIEFEVSEAIGLRNLLERAQDTICEITRLDRVEDAPARLATGEFDVAMLDLTRDHGPGIVTLGRAEVAASRVPIIAVIARADEPQLLHLGARDYLVKSQINSRLLVRTLRSAVERQRLMKELELAREREQFHATRDSMTGLPNRIHFVEQLERALALASREHRQVAVYFLDLDRFKHINDTLGHDVGDALIITMADRLAGISRRSDLVARVGGDEFLMMIQGERIEQAAAVVAEKILAALARPFRVDGREYSFTGSVGVALYPRDGRSAEELIRRADASMYQAKSNGRNAFRLYNHELSAAIERKIAVQTRLRGALEARHLAVHFQPMVDVVRGRIVGCEALARWHDPDLGDVSPAEFVPIAEESGEIASMSEWVLETACALHKSWIVDDFREMRLSVNVSARQLFDESIRDVFVGALFRTGLPPSRLELEVTESMLKDSGDIAANALAQLSEIGIGITLDDYGTGDSSLTLLRRFPIDTLKMDRSIVRDLQTNPDHAALVEAILALGEKLDLRVVAEGVESREQLEFLRHRGCREMQGFFFSPALAGDDFRALLRQGMPIHT